MVVEGDLKEWIFKCHRETLGRGVDRVKARFKSTGTDCSCGGSDRSGMKVRCDDFFNSVGCCLTLTSFKRIIALILAGKKKRIRERLNIVEELMLYLYPLLSFTRVSLSKLSGLERTIDLVGFRGAAWKVLFLFLFVSESNLNPMPAGFGGGFGIPFRVHSHVCGAEWLASAGLHVRLDKRFIIFQN